MPRDRRSGVRWLVSFALILGALMTATPAWADQVPVPDVRGMSEAQARETLARAGLTVAGVETVTTATPGQGYAPGTVYQQAPPPSSSTLPSWLPRGGRVWLRVVGGSTSPRTVTPQPEAPQPVAPRPPTPQPIAPQPVSPQPVAPQPVQPGPTGWTYPGGMRPPPPPAPPGMGTTMGPSTPYVAPGPRTVPMPTQPMPTQPLPVVPGGTSADIAGFTEVPSEPAESPGSRGLRTQVTQYSLPCERLRDVWSLQAVAGWAFTAGTDTGESGPYAGFDMTRWWDGCFGLGFYYRYSAQTFDRIVSGGLLEDSGAFHHIGIKLSYQSTFTRGGRWYWWGSLGFGWSGSTDYQRNFSSFEGYAGAGVGFLLAYRFRLRAGVDMHVSDTKAARENPARDGNSRLLWWFAPHIGFEYDF